VACVPDAYYCSGDTVMICTADQELVPDHQCGDDQACVLGTCVSKCDPRVLTTSNVGCEFWGVDLDNETVDLIGMSNDAAAAQYSVVVANPNDFDVQVEIYQNTARVGEAMSEVIVDTAAIPAGTR
jgi:hypothetical protein